MTIARLAKLSEVAEIDRTIVEPKNIDSGTSYVGLENLRSGGGFVDVRSVANGDLVSTKFRFDERHVLFGKLRPYLAKIGRPDFRGVCSTDILPIRPGPELDRKYLAHFLLTPNVVTWASSRAVGANLPRLSPQLLLTLQVPLPSVDEQRRIADILDRADAAVPKRREAVGEANRLSQSLFLRMFSEKQWTTSCVGDLADRASASIRTGPFGSQLLHTEFVDDGIAVLGIDNVVTNEFRWSGRRFITPAKYVGLRRYTVRPGDVLITIMGTNGRCAIVPDDIGTAINTKHLCCITLDRQKCLPEYLRAYFLFDPAAGRYLDRTAKGAIMSGLNMQIIKMMPVAVPSIELQGEYVRRTRAVEGLRSRLLESLKLTESLVRSLQYRAFTGQL